MTPAEVPLILSREALETLSTLLAVYTVLLGAVVLWSTKP